MTTPKLQLPETANGQANYLLVNSALAALDQLVMPRVVDKDLSTPPGSPANGAMYIVASGNWGTGSSKAGHLAWWLDAVNAWTFLAPAAGMSVRVLDELDGSGLPVVYSYSGSAWVQQPSGGGGGSASGFSEAVIDAGTIDLSDEEIAVWKVILVENITSISLPTALTDEALTVLVLFIQDGTGGRTVSGWPSVTWESGSAPAIGSAAGAITSVPLLILGDGTVYGVN